VAVHALTSAKLPGEAFRVLGPELLTYDEVRIYVWRGLSIEADVSGRLRRNSAKLLDVKLYMFDSTRSKPPNNT